MQFKKACFLMLFGVVVAGPALAAPEGALQFCRRTGLMQPAQSQVDMETISVPAGLGLDDWGAEADHNAHPSRWDLHLRTEQAIEMPRGVRCQTVRAVILPGGKVHRLTAADGRHFEVAGMLKADGSDDPNAVPRNWQRSMDLSVTVAGPFR